MAAFPALLSDPVAACLKRYVSSPGRQPKRLTVAFSGGLDSSVLLHLLAGLRQPLGFSLAAVHVHHGLSPQADAWVQHCTRVCQELGVELEVSRVAVKPAGEGLEAAARAARYQVFASLDTDCLVLAHHRDDQAETVLLQLLRGASLKGLAAMPEVRVLLGRVLLLRPLLAATRAEIAVFAAASGIVWIEDDSNGDLHLARNSLRHGVLPGLASRFPEAPKALAQAAVQFAEAASLLDSLADLDGRAAISQAGLLIPALQRLPEPRARNLLRRFLERSGAEIHPAALREALRQLCSARPDAQVCLVFGNVRLHRHRQRAVIEVGKEAARTGRGGDLTESRAWQGETDLDLGEAGRLQFQAVIGAGVRLSPGVVSIRRRQGGERLRPGFGRPHRTLKNLLREAGIPAWQRETLPLVYLGETLVWAASIGPDSSHLAKQGEPGWLILWQARPNTAM